MSYLKEFYREAVSKKKAKLNEELQTEKKIGVQADTNLDFYGTFTSLMKPELAKDIEKYRETTVRQRNRMVDIGLKQGMSWEDISAQSGVPLESVEQYSQTVNKDYGVTPQKSNFQKAKEGAGNVIKAIGSSYERVGKSTGEALAYGKKDLVSAREAEQSTLDQNAQLIANAARQLQDPTTPPEKKERLKRLIDILGGETQQIASRASQESKRTQEQLDPVKNVAALANIGMDIVTAGTIGNAAKTAKTANLARQTAAGAAQGATAGVFGAYEVGGADTTLKDIATGAAIGGVIGGGLTAGSGKLGQWVSDKQAAKKAAREAITTRTINGEMDEAALKAINAMDAEDAFMKSQGITNPARLLPDGTDSKAARLLEIDNELDVFKKSGVGDPKAMKPLQLERNQLVKEIDEIKNPVNRVAEQINLLDGELQRAQRSGDVVLVKKLQEQSDFMAKEAQRIDNIDMYTEAGMRKSSAAARTEAEDIADGITKGYGEDVVSYAKEPGWLKNQADMSVKLMDQDYELAKRIALGQEPAPGNLQASSVYEAVKKRARAEGDVELRGRLATESTVPTQGTKAGQFNAAFANRERSDPVVAIQDIIKARKNSSLKIPASVTKEEQEQIIKMGDALEELKTKLMNNPTQATRDAYGAAWVKYDNYINDKIRAANKKTLAQHFSSPTEAVNTAIDIAGVSKSMNATFDNSFGFKQGWKVLTTHPSVWGKAWLKSWGDILKTFKGEEVMDAVHAQVASHPMMLNGKFRDYKIDLPGLKGYKGEEFFPSTALEKLPGKNAASGVYNKSLGRLFKASDTAYTGMQLRMRLDLAEALITKAEQSGIVDISDPKERKAIGNLINSLTGRGNLGKLESAARPLNNVFFSPRFAKSNIDALGGHLITGAGGKGGFKKGAGAFVRREAAKNLLKMTALAGTTLAIADAMWPGSVEWDPRSSDAGKIKIGNTRFDVTGGMGSFVTMYARQATGKTKSASSGELKSLTSGDPYSDNRWDALWRFTENKFSPAMGVVRDVIRGENFDGKQPTPKSIGMDLITPMMIDNMNELKNTPNSANLLMGMIADGLGISTNTYDSSVDWNTKRSQQSKELQGFKQKVGKEKFDEANKEYNKRYNEWFSSVREDPKFWKLSLEERSQYVTTVKQKMRDDVLKSYGYEYKKTKRTNEAQSIINELDKYKK